MQASNKSNRGASRQNANNKKRQAKVSLKKNGSSFGKPQAAAVAKSSKFRNKNPVIRFERDGSSCRINHTERIGTLLGSVSFAVNSYAINPGLPASFPFLSGIANRFESYRFEKLRFHFKTKTATSAVGDVIQVIDYDASDGAPESSIQAEAYQGAISSAPWQDTINDSTKSNLHKFPSRYVRGEAIPANTDVKLYDVGTYYACTENQGSAALVGYLYVEYDVVLMTPQLRASDFGISGGLITGATAQTAANPFGTGATVDATGRGISISAASVVTFSSPNTYVVTLRYLGTVFSAFSYTAGSGGTATAITSEIFNAGATAGIVTFSMVTTVPNVTLTLSATATTISSAYCIVGSCPASSLASPSNEWFLISDEIKKKVETRPYKLCSKHEFMKQKLGPMGLSTQALIVYDSCPDCLVGKSE